MTHGARRREAGCPASRRTSSPSLTALIGDRAWWPGNANRRCPPARENPAP